MAEPMDRGGSLLPLSIEPETHSVLGDHSTPVGPASQRALNVVLTFAIHDSTLGQIVGRKLHPHLVAGDNSDEVLPHLAGHVSQHFHSGLQLHSKPSVGQSLGYRSAYFKRVVFRHTSNT